MSPPAGSGRRRGGSTSRNNGAGDSGSTGVPPSESMTTLYSSDWKTLAKNKEADVEMLDLFRSKKEEFEQHSLQPGDLSEDDLRKMCALYRYQHQHQLSTIKELQKNYKDVKARVKRLTEPTTYSHRHISIINSPMKYGKIFSPPKSCIPYSDAHPLLLQK